MIASLDGYRSFVDDAEAAMSERVLRDVERRVAALILPATVTDDASRAALAEAVYAQAQHEGGCRPHAATEAEGLSLDNRLKSVRVGELSFALGDAGLTREQALFPKGFSALARAALLDSGLFYRGVSA